MTLFEELKARGLIAQLTHEEEIKELLDKEKVVFYIGFDPTADSLHVGHFLQLVVMSHMQRAGHTPIALIGGGTAMVGDPTGRTDMRQMMTQETIRHNGDCFKKQMSKLVDFGPGKAIMVNNADWLLDLNYVNFLREIGVHFSVNRMLTAECFKSRLERGLSFLEFNYMLMQSYDFLMLYEKHHCRVQLGGDDQWSNILGGVDLIRRKTGASAYGMTFTLLTTSEGKKMGKTQGGAVWLDPNKTTPYDFFQYWRNIDDADTIKCLKMLTFLPLEQIEDMKSWENTSRINEAKEILAFELTKMVHGQQEAEKALEAARSLFGAGVSSDNMPSSTVGKDVITNGLMLVDALVLTGIAKSKGDARRLIEQGGIMVDDKKMDNLNECIDASVIETGYFIIKKGKKTFHKVILN